MADLHRTYRGAAYCLGPRDLSVWKVQFGQRYGSPIRISLAPCTDVRSLGLRIVVLSRE